MAKIKPLVFVAMPFGEKEDPLKKYLINFDDIYKKAIKPAVKGRGLDLDIIRADEERNGGIIHAPMYERLLLAEIVIADVTLANPNVFYELGVRHCARPRSTVLIYAKEGHLPFDIYMDRAIPYELQNGKITQKEANRLKKEISNKLKNAVLNDVGVDSPLFQLISKFGGIKDLPHDVTESFRDRVIQINNIRNNLAKWRNVKNKKQAVQELRKINKDLGKFNDVHAELFIDLILSYRDVEAWGDMIKVIDSLPIKYKNHITIREQKAFALNRRNKNNDRIGAVRILKNIIDQYGVSPETCGLLGRIYKDYYSEAKRMGNMSKAEGFLDEAIRVYTEGFSADPRDYYPGVNAVTLLYVKGTSLSLQNMKNLLPAVTLAVTRRGGISSSDYWDVATTLELSVLSCDWQQAKRIVQKMLTMNAPSWNYKSTVNNLSLIRKARKNRKENIKEVEEIINALKKEYSS